LNPGIAPGFFHGDGESDQRRQAGLGAERASHRALLPRLSSIPKTLGDTSESITEHLK
jgi:hypothetical protein